MFITTKNYYNKKIISDIQLKIADKMQKTYDMLIKQINEID